MRNCSHIFGFAILLFFRPFPAFAQQDPLLTQYMYVKLQFNPAYAGGLDIFSADLLTRFQWTGVEGAPRTVSLTAHTPLRDPHIGLGGYFYRDALGPSLDYNIMASFAYRILFPQSTLSFGVSAGIKYLDIDWNSLHPRDAWDPLLADEATDRLVPDVDFGVYYSHPRFFAGLSARHLLQSRVVVSSAAPDDKVSFTRLLTNMYGMAGGSFMVAGQIEFLPSVLIKYVANAPLQADIDARFVILKVLTLGAVYRTTKALGLMTGVDVGKGFSVGYSYDIWFNELRTYNGGSHELRVSWGADLFKRTRMLTPRYF